MNIHCEFQGLKPKGETKRSLLVLHPSSGEDTVNTVGSHLNPPLDVEIMKLSLSVQRVKRAKL